MNYRARRLNLMNQLPEKCVVVIFAQHEVKRSADASYPFEVNRNFYYLCGIDEPLAVLMMVKDKSGLSEKLFIRDIDLTMEKWVGTFISKEKAAKISGITQVEFISIFDSTLTKILDQQVELFIEYKQLDKLDALTLAQQLEQRLTQSHPSTKIHNIFDQLARLRMIKSEEEIQAIKQAIALTDSAFRHALDHLHLNTKENDIHADFQHYLTKHHSKLAFDLIVAAGKRACVLHYVANNQDINQDDLILMDMGAQFEYYNADITRVFPKSKTYSEKQKKYIAIVLEAMDAIMEAVKPGVTLKQLNDIVISIYQKRLKEIGLIESDDQVSEYYYHGVSHHLGLDTHDISDRTLPLEVGNVITIEPGLYIAHEGIGIRIEDDVLVVADGCVNLSKDVIKTPEQIEAYLQSNKQTS